MMFYDLDNDKFIESDEVCDYLSQPLLYALVKPLEVGIPTIVTNISVGCESNTLTLTTPYDWVTDNRFFSYEDMVLNQLGIIISEEVKLQTTLYVFKEDVCMERYYNK